MKKILLGVLFAASAVLFHPPQARADISCWSASSTIPAYTTPNLALAPLCDTSGNLKITGTITATDVLPYNGTNGQTLTTNSFAGVGGLDAGNKFSPLQEDASQNLLVKVNVALPTGANTIGNVGLVAGSAIIGKVGIDQTTPGTTNGVQVNAALPAGTNTIGNVNQTTGTSGYSYLLDSAGANKGSINAPGALLVAQGKTTTILTSASATACTNIQATGGNLVEIVNVGSATTVFPAFYNDAGATCATGTRVYGNFTSLTLQAGQAILLNIPLSAGLAYKLSGALSDNLVVVTN